MSAIEKFNESAAMESGSATLLAIRKSMECNPALLYSADSKKGLEGELKPVTVDESTVLGVQSQAGLDEGSTIKKKNPSQEDIEAFEAERMLKVISANPQRIETSFLPPEHDTLVYQFTARANGQQGLPLELCSSPALANHLSAAYDHYCKIGGATYLGELFAANLADARFAFRNRAAERIETTVTVRASKTLPDGKAFKFVIDADNTTYLDHLDYQNPVTDDDVKALGEIIGRGLSGDELVMIEVESRLKIGYGQEVFPSQEMTDDGGSKTALGRVYYKDPNTRQAKVHAQKIGNGVRRIDIWHPSIKRYGPLPAEPYGNYARRAVAVRLKDNFYKRFLRPEFASLYSKQPTVLCQSLFAAEKLSDLHAIDNGNVHFFMAILMRGGVLGLESDKKSKDSSD